MTIPALSDLTRDGVSAFAAGGGGGGGSFTASESAPGSPAAGDRWLNTATGVEYAWYVDADSGQWVSPTYIASGPVITGPQGEAAHWLGPYNIATDYVAGDIVSYSGSSYVALEPIAGSGVMGAPGVDTRWLLVASVGAAGTTLRTATFFIDIPLAGDKSTLVILPYAGTIIGWKLITEGSSGDCEVDIWKAASAIPTISNSIVGADPIDGQGVKSSTSMIGWSTSLAVNDVLRMSITSPGGASSILVTLVIQE